MKPSEIKREPPKILLYGPFSTGKTALVFSAGDQAEVLMTDRNNWESAITYKDSLTETRQQVELTPCYEDAGKPGSGYVKLRDRLIKIMQECNKGTYPYKILAIDTLTTMSEQIKRMVAANCNLIDPTTGVYRTGISKNPFEIQHWGLIIAEIQNILGLLRSLPMCCILIAHDESEKKGDVTKSIIAVVGAKLPNEIPTYFTEVWYSMILPAPANQPAQHVIQTMPSSMVGARTSSGLTNYTKMSLGLKEIFRQMGREL